MKGWPSRKRRPPIKKMTRRMRGGSTSSPHVYVFYHIFCNDNTLDIVRDQATKIIYSGLYDDTTHIYCFLTGNKVHIDAVKSYIDTLPRKFIVKEIGENDTSYERFTLTKIDKMVKDSDFILYIHTKGVSRSQSKDIISDHIYLWRNYMEWYLIKNYKKCIEKLATHDVVGAIYKDWKIGPHFSGNFWWTTGSYYKKLSRSKQIEGDYYAPEAYLFKGGPRHYYIDGGVIGNHTCMYSTPIHMKLYVDKPLA